MGQKQATKLIIRLERKNLGELESHTKWSLATITIGCYGRCYEGSNKTDPIFSVFEICDFVSNDYFI